MFEIETDVPAPEDRATGGWGPGRRKYPFDTMQVGDSFLIPGMERVSKLGGVVMGASRRTGFAFTSKKLPEGIRIWRIA